MRRPLYWLRRGVSIACGLWLWAFGLAWSTVPFLHAAVWVLDRFTLTRFERWMVLSAVAFGWVVCVAAVAAWRWETWASSRARQHAMANFDAVLAKLRERR